MPMTRPTTITCGTDFSDGARRAATVAAALAVRLGARLQLVHVVDDLGAELTFAEGREGVYEPRRQTLESDAAELRRAYPVTVETVFEPGVADEHLVDTARRARSALLVVSSLGHTRQHARWLLGSIAERVAQTATVPVLVVRDGHGLIEWASGTRALKVLVGVDDGAPARAALDWVGELRQQAPCDLQIMRIVLPSEEHARLGVPPPVPLEGLRPPVERLLRRELRRWTGDVPGEGAVSWLVEGNWGRMDSPLLNEARRTAADVVVVGTNQRAGLARAWQGSVSRHVLHAADGDVVTVPASPRRVSGVARCVDAICLATHGRTGLSQLVLGSVAQHVVREARCPVVLLPPHSTLLPVELGQT